MDPVRVSSPIESVPGNSLWIPFYCVNIKSEGTYDRVLAQDLPVFAAKDEALNFMMNNPHLDKTPLEWVEFSYEEILEDSALKPFAAARNLITAIIRRGH